MKKKLQRWLSENLGVTPRHVVTSKKAKRRGGDKKAKKDSTSLVNHEAAMVAQTMASFSMAEERVRRLIGEALDDHDENDDTCLSRIGAMIERISIIPKMVRNGGIVASSPLVDRERNELFVKAARVDEVVRSFMDELASIRDVPAILSVIQPSGTRQMFKILEGLFAIRQANICKTDAKPSDLLLRVAMFDIVYEWVDMTDEMPEGPFDPDAEFCGPDHSSGAEFVYRVLIEAGWDCTRDEVLANLPAVTRQMAALRWGDEA